MRQAVTLARTAVIVSLVVFCFCMSGVTSAGAAETVKIGHICSVSGWAGMLGTPQKQALLACVENVNSKGGIGGKQVEVFVEDDQSSPTTASIAAIKLIRDTKVDIIIGTTLSDTTMAVVPIAEKEQVPMIVTSPAEIAYDKLKWIYSIGPSDVKMAANTLELAVSTMGAKRIAIFHDSALYGMQGSKIILRDVAKYPGVSVVIQEKYDVKDTNMVPQLAKIKAANPDLMILYGTGAPAAIVAKNFKQLQLTIPVVGAGGLGAPDFLAVVGNIAEESKWAIMLLKISLAESFPANDPWRKTVYEPMKKIYQDKYGKDKGINVFHASPMDAFTMASMAIKAAGKHDRASIRDALEKVRFTGVMGGKIAPSATDHQEGNEDSSVLGMLKGGQFVPYVK